MLVVVTFATNLSAQTDSGFGSSGALAGQGVSLTTLSDLMAQSPFQGSIPQGQVQPGAHGRRLEFKP